MFMCHFNDRTQIRTDPIVGRIVYKNCGCIRILTDRPFHLRNLHSEWYPQFCIHFRIYIHRNRTAQYQCIDHAFMYISRQNDLVTCLAAGKHHSLHGRSCSANHKKGMIRTKCFRCQFFCFLDHRNRMTEVIQRLHGIDIQADTFFSQKIRKFRISSSAFMSRYIKRHNSSSF